MMTLEQARGIASGYVPPEEVEKLAAEFLSVDAGSRLNELEELQTSVNGRLNEISPGYANLLNGGF